MTFGQIQRNKIQQHTCVPFERVARRAQEPDVWLSWVNSTYNFYAFFSFSSSRQQLSTRLSECVCELCLVHSWTLYFHYVCNVRRIDRWNIHAHIVNPSGDINAWMRRATDGRVVNEVNQSRNKFVSQFEVLFFCSDAFACAARPIECVSVCLAHFRTHRHPILQFYFFPISFRCYRLPSFRYSPRPGPHHTHRVSLLAPLRFIFTIIIMFFMLSLSASASWRWKMVRFTRDGSSWPDPDEYWVDKADKHTHPQSASMEMPCDE